jgi:transcriptional regulator with XRE-family HTH domain
VNTGSQRWGGVTVKEFAVRTGAARTANGYGTSGMAHATMDEFGAELVRWMDQRGIGVRGLARQAGYSPGHISDLRSGRRAPSTEMAADLDDALGADGALRAAARRPAPPGGLLGAGMRGVPPVAAHLGNAQPEPWELADALTRSSLSMTAVGFLEQSVTGLAASYPFTPPADLYPGVHTMLRAVSNALGRPQPLSVRARCARLAGMLCGLAGQIADDAGRPDKSAAWFAAALVAADETADLDLAAWVLALRSIGCHFRGEYILAADLLDRARDTASAFTARRQAWLGALSARAHAAVAARGGNRAQQKSVVMHVLDDARDRLEAAGPASDTDFFDDPRLAGMAGTTMLLLGDTRAAEMLISQALATRAEGDLKGRALLTLDLAECMVVNREPDQAAGLVGRAVGMAGSDIVRPVITRATAVHHALQPWSASRGVRELGGQLAEMKIAGTES